MLVTTGLVAERCFGFDGSVSQADVDVERDHSNARALGNSLLVCLIVPWALCLVSYTGDKATDAMPYKHGFRATSCSWCALCCAQGVQLLSCCPDQSFLKKGSRQYSAEVSHNSLHPLPCK